MSHGWAVRSEGLPYLGFFQSALAGMDADNGPGRGGEFTLGVRFALHALPVRLAADDEVHPLFVFSDNSPGALAAVLLGLGVTPNGAVVGLTPGGGTISTAPGTLVPDGVMRDASLVYTVSPFAQLVLGGALVSTSTLPGGAPAPGPGLLSMFTLFNGPSAISQCRCRISFATYGGEDGSVEWAVSEGHGGTLAGVDVADDFGGADFTLRAGAYPALWGFPDYPHGEVPYGQSIDDHYGWVRSTDYARLAPPVTRYQRETVS